MKAKLKTDIKIYLLIDKNKKNMYHKDTDINLCLRKKK